MQIKARVELEEIRPYALGQSIAEIKNQFGIQTVRRMSDNENVYGTSCKVKEALANAIGQLNMYPDGLTNELIDTLSLHYKLDRKHFLVSNGSEEIIRLLTRAYINKNDEAIMAEVTFPRYQTNVMIEGGKVIKVPMVNGGHDLENMLKEVNDRTKMIFVCNPNNPTGTIVGKNELFHFVNRVPPHVLIIVDEAYFEYVDSEEYLDTLPLLSEHTNLVILRTFSKIYGLASLRVGYGMMAEVVATELHKVRDVFNVNQLAQIAAIAALKDQAFVADCAAKNAIERDFFQRELKRFGIESYPSETNFLFAYTDRNVIGRFLENGILVREMTTPEYNEAFRITLGTREDHEFILKILQQLIHERAV